MTDITQINYDYLTHRIFSLNAGQTSDFEALALELFALQYHYNPLYHDFCRSLKVEPKNVNEITQIPFLPIATYKSQEVLTSLTKKTNPEIFTSSGTTTQNISRHVVNDIAVYHKSFTQGFRLFYGDPANYCMLALLPSYLERTGSSLVYMADALIKQSGHPDSGFYLNNLSQLKEKLTALMQQKQKTLLLGVSYALIDLAETGIKLSNDLIVMETGGMKGKRPEMPKAELHEYLKQKLSVKQIHSEYGMTELLSQAYSKGEGLFACPPWMKVLIRDGNDPFNYLAPGKTGGINVIDLANLNSCCFIATQDLGKMHADEKFELMGRFDNSDLRGCNLLVS